MSTQPACCLNHLKVPHHDIMSLPSTDSINNKLKNLTPKGQKLAVLAGTAALTTLPLIAATVFFPGIAAGALSTFFIVNGYMTVNYITYTQNLKEVTHQIDSLYSDFSTEFIVNKQCFIQTQLPHDEFELIKRYMSSDNSVTHAIREETHYKFNGGIVGTWSIQPLTLEEVGKQKNTQQVLEAYTKTSRPWIDHLIVLAKTRKVPEDFLKLVGNICGFCSRSDAYVGNSYTCQVNYDHGCIECMHNTDPSKNCTLKTPAECYTFVDREFLQAPDGAMSRAYSWLKRTVLSQENASSAIPATATSGTVQEIPHKVLAKPQNEEDIISEFELQQGISISEATVSKIQTCMQNILQREEGNGLKLYNSQPNNRVFTLETAPGLIFKMTSNAKNRYRNMIDAQTAIRTNQLGLLVIPNAKLFTINFEGQEYDIIAEKCLDLSHESRQEQYFQDYEENLNEAVRQLAVFICKTGYSDVEWRNNPVLNNSLDEHGNMKIALIDTEEMKWETIGLFGGGWGRRGLVRCVTEAQGRLVEAVAEQHGVCTNAFANAHAARKREIEEDRNLKEYYISKKITGNELIEVDENSINFSEHPEKTKELREFTRNLVQAINHKISTASPKEAVKERRKVFIDTNQPPLLNPFIDGFRVFTNDEEMFNATYLGYVAKKLVESGAIHNFHWDGTCYVQA